ncbi:bHLH-PAS domain containing transcription factor, ARNT/BMAL superfamily [Oopsacas minuta]|uniref:BHLH-PAS domain containing transcription factor, ARNT/BMAL superfamily n=1 Tax=Oopsacas minuta TaxID=111878 RepID=A0AAV7KI45_9METZ|nr:bHLH-PAS domain containing transcription factor, ARNT/BMAL superfamily [Oopsacas minuta]
MSDQTPELACSTLPDPKNCDQSKGKRKRFDVQTGKKINKIDSKQALGVPTNLTDESDPQHKGHHNAVEKKRRDKMNTYIQDIRHLIIKSSDFQVSCKSDKLSVLKAAYQCLCKMRGIPNVSASIDCPSFLFEDEIKQIISKMKCGFIMVTDATEGTIVWDYNLDINLGYKKGELFGSSIFSLIKQTDVTTYKLNSIPNTTGLIRIANKRSFICNFISKAVPITQELSSSLETYQYLPILLSGEVKEIQTSLLLGDRAATSDLGECIKCFIAIGQGLTTEVLDVTQDMRESVKVLSREGPDGKIENIHDSIFYILGYTPSELVGHTFLEFVHPHDGKRLYNSLFEASNIRKYTELIFIRLKHKSGIYKTVSVKRLAVRHPTQGTITSFISCMDETFILEENWDNMFPVEVPIVEKLNDPFAMLCQETFIPRIFPLEMGVEQSQVPSYPNILNPKDFDGELSTLFDTPIFLKEAVEKYEYAQNFVNQPFEGQINNNIPTGFNSLMTNFVDIFTSQPF